VRWPAANFARFRQLQVLVRRSAIACRIETDAIGRSHTPSDVPTPLGRQLRTSCCLLLLSCGSSSARTVIGSCRPRGIRCGSGATNHGNHASLGGRYLKAVEKNPRFRSWHLGSDWKDPRHGFGRAWVAKRVPFLGRPRNAPDWHDIPGNRSAVHRCRPAP
jgi:hypothetical protein